MGLKRNVMIAKLQSIHFTAWFFDLKREKCLKVKQCKRRCKSMAGKSPAIGPGVSRVFYFPFMRRSGFKGQKPAGGFVLII